MALSSPRRSPRLPPAARRRLAEAASAGLWSSPLSVGDEAALRSVGFRPLGVVTASIPSWPFPYRYPPALARRRGGVTSAYPQHAMTPTWSVPDDALSASRLGGFSRDYARGQTTGLVPDLGWTWEKVVGELHDRQLFEAALDHLRLEASMLGAVGVVGIDLAWMARQALSSEGIPVSEVRAVGLAVGVPGPDTVKEPFTAVLRGAEIAMLLREGLVPVAAVFGVGRVHADLGNVTRKRLRSLGMGDVHQFSEALERALQIGMTDIERRSGGSGLQVVGCRPRLLFERELTTGLDVTCRVTGTAVIRVDRPAPVDPLPILSLK